MSAYEESDEYCPHCDNHYVRLFLPLDHQNLSFIIILTRSSTQKRHNLSLLSTPAMLGRMLGTTYAFDYTTMC